MPVKVRQTYYNILPSDCTHDVPIAAKAQPIPKVTFVDNEAEFRWALLEDQMAFDKLHEGIKKFAQDGETLKDQLRKKMTVA